MGKIGKIGKPGRPSKFKTVDDLQSAIDGYFNSCFEINAKTGELMQVKPFTITGLALALDTSRETLLDIEYGNGPYADNSSFSDAIKKAKLRCQNYAEEQMFTAYNPAGPIFALKNYGWKDKQDIELNANIRTVEEFLDEV
jgi:hypothetical protein